MKKQSDNKPKPKPKLPELRLCPVCGSKGKVHQPPQGVEGCTSVICRKCDCGTINRYPQPGETNRECKIKSILEWNDGVIFDPSERSSLSKKAKRAWENQKKKHKKKKHL